MQLPGEFQAQQQELQRKKMLADMLMAQGMQQPQGQMVSGHYVSPGILGNLAPLAKAFMGHKMQGKVDQGQQELQQNYQNSLAKAMQEYQAKAQTDPLAAAQGAATSEYDPIRQIAKADYERLQKAMAPRTVGGELVQMDPNTKQVTSLYNTNSQWTPIEEVTTDKEGRPLKGQIDKKSGLVRIAPGQGSGIQINTRDSADVAFDKALGAKQVGIISDSYEKALAAGKSIENLDAAGKMIESGIKTGAASDIQMGFARWAETLGIQPPDPEVGMTEAYKANMARETMNLIKNLGSGSAISNADLTFAEKASGGDTGITEEGLLGIINLARVGAANVALEHQRIMGTTKDETGNIPPRLRIFDVPVPQLEAPEGEQAALEAGAPYYFDPKVGKYRIAKPKTVKQDSVEGIQGIQGVKPIGTNAEGKPQYRLDDLIKAQRQ